MDDFFKEKEKGTEKIFRDILPLLQRFKLAVEYGQGEVGALLKDSPGDSHNIGKRAIDTLLAELISINFLLPDQKLIIKGQATEAGEALLALTESIIQGIHDLRTTLLAMRPTGVLTIASIHSSWLSYGEEIRNDFAQLVPEVQLSYVHRPNSLAVQEAVQKQEAMAGILSWDKTTPEPTKPLCVKHWLYEEMVLVFSARRKRLPNGAGGSTKEHIKNDQNKFITLGTNSSMFPLTSRYVKHKLGISMPQINEGFTSIESVKAQIKQSPECISIVPRICVQQEPEISFYDLIPDMERRHLKIVYRENAMWEPIWTLVEKVLPEIARRHRPSSAHEDPASG